MSYGGEQEYEYEWPDDGNDQEGWGEEGSDGENNNPMIQIENNFYEAEGNMKDKPKESID